MSKVFDKCTSIVFDNGGNVINHRDLVEIDNFDDYIIIKTAITIDEMYRGWIGNLTFVFTGYNLPDASETHDQVTLKDMLCCSRNFSKYHDEFVMWEYKFLKH